MNNEQDETQAQADPAGQQAAQQQQAPQAAESHAGQGAESALKQLHVWEQRRATHSGGKRRPQ